MTAIRAFGRKVIKRLTLAPLVFFLCAPGMIAAQAGRLPVALTRPSLLAGKQALQRVLSRAVTTQSQLAE